MNHQTQLHQLEKRILSYRNFMPLCNEIIKISNRIEQLRKADEFELKQKVVVFYDTKQSKMNFKNI